MCPRLVVVFCLLYLNQWIYIHFVRSTCAPVWMRTQIDTVAEACLGTTWIEATLTREYS